MLKKLRFIILLVLVIFIATNPNINDFKDYVGVGNDLKIFRSKNYFIFSKYKVETNSEALFDINKSIYYYGLLGNFIAFDSINQMIHSDEYIQAQFEKEKALADSIELDRIKYNAAIEQAMADSIAAAFIE
jgi:hypothetical protein